LVVGAFTTSTLEMFLCVASDVIGKNNAEDFRAFAPDSWTRYGAYKKVVEQSRARFIKYTWLSKDKDLIKKGNWR
jgi:hypothetical protein